MNGHRVDAFLRAPDWCSPNTLGSSADQLTLLSVPGIPLIKPGDDLAAIFSDALENNKLDPQHRDVLVVAQKVVSKAERRYIDLRDVTPSARARDLGQSTDKDPRLVEVILSESREVLRHRPGLLIVAHRLGYVMANAGVDQSNLEPAGSAERVLLLPEDPNASCIELKRRLQARFGVELAVVMSDSVGRAWRNGTTGTALGAAGLPALENLRGRDDLYGRRLEVSEVGLADQLAAAAELLMGEADEGRPLVLVRGLQWDAPASDADSLVRPIENDLFR